MRLYEPTCYRAVTSAPPRCLAGARGPRSTTPLASAPAQPGISRSSRGGPGMVRNHLIDGHHRRVADRDMRWVSGAPAGRPGANRVPDRALPLPWRSSCPGGTSAGEARCFGELFIAVELRAVKRTWRAESHGFSTATMAQQHRDRPLARRSPCYPTHHRGSLA